VSTNEVRLDEELTDDKRCFACGSENPIGLRMTYAIDGDGTARSRVVLSADMQGWRGIAHGGIVMTMIDDAMAYAVDAAGHRGVSASMNTRFRKPVPIGMPVVVSARVTSTRMRVLNVEAAVCDEGGDVLVRAEGMFVSRGAVTPGRLTGSGRADDRR